MELQQFEESELDFREYLHVLKRRKWIIIQTTLLLGLVAYLMASVQTPMYESSSLVLLRPNDSAEQLYPGYSVEVFSDPDRYVSSQLNIVQSEGVARLAAEALPGAPNALMLLGEVSASQGGLTDVIAITGHSIDPVRARDVANAFSRAYIENRRLYAVAGLQKAVDEIGLKLTQLQQQIAQYDKAIGDGGIAIGAGTTPTPPSGAGIPGPTPPDIAGPTGSGLDDGALPTSDEALKAARYAAATQYQSLFFRQQELTVDISLKRGNAEMIADAQTPVAPVSPTPKRDGALGAIVGFVLGVGLAFLREQLDDRIRTREDAERAASLPVLGDLPRTAAGAVQGAPAAIAHPHGPLAEAIRSLRTSLVFLGVDTPIRRILVTSPGPADGKSTVAANLAAVYAQAGQRTVVVSGDLRRPTIERAFGVERGEAGLSEVLAGMAALPVKAEAAHTSNVNGNGYAAPPDSTEQVLVHIDSDLSVLPAGRTPPNPAELLGSRRMSELLDELSEQFDIVIIDTPPLLAVTDAAALAPSVDAVLLVAALNETHRGALKRALELVRNADVGLFGLVLNKVESSATGYYRYYGYYGEDGPKTRRARRAARKADARQAKQAEEDERSTVAADR